LSEPEGQGAAQAPLLRAAQLGVWFLTALLVLLLWLFPDAISRLRQLSAPYAQAPETCELAQGACTATFADGGTVTLDVEPRDVVATEPATFRVRVAGEGAPTLLELQGIDMNMGLIRIPLARQGDVYVATSPLPACTLHRMAWRVDVLLPDRAAGFVLWTRRR